MSTKEMQKLSSFPSMFNDFSRPWSDFPGGSIWNKMQNLPAANVVELADRFKISLAAPRLTKEDFTIDVDRHMLTVSSEKEEKNESEDENYTRKEYNYSSFSRSFNLPEDVQADKISARYINGVLELDLPKKEAASKATDSRKIAVS